MKKTVLLLLCPLMLLTGCGTYTGQGAYVGGSFGAILGSAIGGISGGRRGSDIGTLVGVASGAMVGAAVGAAADQKVNEERADYRRRRAQADYESGRVRSGTNNRRDYDDDDDDRDDDDSGYDAQGRGDDRIDFDAPGPRDGRGTYSAAQPRSVTPTAGAEPGYRENYNAEIEIRNARIIDADRNGVLRGGEECKVTFEVMNNSEKTLYDVQPTVFDVTGNKHVHISPNLHVESIAPHSGIRYTASILADRKLKDGTIVIRVGVAQGNRQLTSQMEEFTVRTEKQRK